MIDQIVTMIETDATMAVIVMIAEVEDEDADPALHEDINLNLPKSSHSHEAALIITSFLLEANSLPGEMISREVFADGMTMPMLHQKTAALIDEEGTAEVAEAILR